MRRNRTSVPQGHLFTAKDLSFKIARDVKIYLWLCLAFYLLIPIIYYRAHLDWTMVDSFYVSSIISTWHIQCSVDCIISMSEQHGSEDYFRSVQFICLIAVSLVII